jgi:hypothetical protein
MITVLQTHSVSWAESVRLALLGAGIEAILLDQYSPGTLGLAGSVRVAIVNDLDLPRAERVVADLPPAHLQVASSWWWHKRALMTGLVAFLTLFGGSSMAESAGKPLLAAMLALLGGVLFAISLILVLLGYRADKQHPIVQQDTSAVDESDDQPS